MRCLVRCLHLATRRYLYSDRKLVCGTYRLIWAGRQNPLLAGFAICFRSSFRASNGSETLIATQTIHDVCSATLFLVTGTPSKNIAFSMHLSDGPGAESNMHVESAIGFSTRWIIRNHRRLSSDKAALCTRVHTLTRLKETAQRLLENLVLQMFP